MDKQTSDERLLKLIENSGEPKHKQPASPQGRKSLADLMPSKLNFHEFKGKLKNLRIDLRLLNKGLVALSILTTFILLYAVFSAPKIPKSNTAFFSAEGDSSTIKLISSGAAKGLARKNFSGQGLKRDFFVPSGTAISNIQEPKEDFTERFRGLKLVGIIWSQKPDVIIENTKDSRTYSLKKGESFNGQFKVAEISRNSATLEVSTADGPKQFELR